MLYLPEGAEKLPLRGKTSPAPGEDVTVGDKKGNLDATDGSGLRGFAPGDTPSVFASQIHLPRKGEVLLYLPEGAEKLPLRGKTSPAPGEDVA